MKDYINEIIDRNLNRADNQNRICEYIQKYFLYILYKKKIYKNLIFAGGTALRFIYNIKRFSEDLDFSLSSNAKNYDFLELLEMAKREFRLSGYNLDIKYSTEKNVNSAFFKFPGLLFEYGLSLHKEEKISIKVEIDTNPPEGGEVKVNLYNSTFMFYLLHYNLPSLFAGKLHALLCRKYTKGRDWYDLVWYLTNFKDLKPNFVMLKNAIKQVCNNEINIEDKDWKNVLKGKVKEIDMEKVKKDVYRFLDDHLDIKLLTKKNLFKLLS